MTISHAPAFQLTRPVELTCFGLCVANVVYLAASFVHGSWLIGGNGLPMATDFVNVFAAGQLVWAGHPADAYDPQLHKAAGMAALGQSFDGAYPWAYPPIFLFVAALLATMPYVSAHVVWVGVTFAGYAAVICGILRDRIGLLFACAFPGILSNFLVGQNGFVTAGLLGGMLIFLQRQPIIAGILLGLLSFKPHFGIILPLVLALAGYWRVLTAAAITALLLAAASWLAFGTGSWEAFLHALPIVSREALSEGRAEFAKLQSIFGLVRVFGGSETLAWTLQWLLTAATAVLASLLWRSRRSFNVKAAGLATGVLLATPYLFLYDLVILSVAMVFLLREMQSGGTRSGEMIGLMAAAALILIFPLVKAPVGFVAVIIVAALVARRAVLAPHTVPQRAARASAR